MFGVVLISVCTVMHIYVFWRAASAPFVKRWVSRKVLLTTGIVLWGLLLLGRTYGHDGTGMAL